LGYELIEMSVLMPTEVGKLLMLIGSLGRSAVLVFVATSLLDWRRMETVGVVVGTTGMVWVVLVSLGAGVKKAIIRATKSKSARIVRRILIFLDI